MDRKTIILMLTMELSNTRQALDKMYAENSKRIDDMLTSVSILETELAKDEKDSN